MKAKVRTYVDRERSLTQWWTRLFLRVEHPRETFPPLWARAFLPRNFRQGRAGRFAVGVLIIERSLTWFECGDRGHHGERLRCCW
jgi:hypothetical protein